jgi:YVTN family beta-propeller protein
LNYVAEGPYQPIERPFISAFVPPAGYHPRDDASADGRYCFVSWSGDDKISAISYKSRSEVAQIPVGDHPQRMRIGGVTRSWLLAQP